MRNLVISLALTTALSCASVPAPTIASPHPAGDLSITALAFSRDRSTLWYTVGGEHCEVRALATDTRTERVAFRLDWCPTSITVIEDETLLLTDGVRLGAWKRPDGADLLPGVEVLAVTDVSNYVTARDEMIVWKRGRIETDLGPKSSIRRLRTIPVTGDLLAVKRTVEGERIVRITEAGENDVTPVFPSIESMDVAPRGDEIVFSARRENGFDVAIASPDGKTVNWVAPDRADEVGVTWAPRGNKVSFLMRGADSTLVRSVHVPTAFQLTFDTPAMRVRAIAWEPRAERFAMGLDGPAASPHIDWIEYAGTNRESLVAPRHVLKREPEGVAFGSGSALLLPPATIRYGERQPLFVRLTDEPLSWSSELLDLESLGGAILLVRATSWGAAPLAALQNELKWVDPDAIVVIDSASSVLPKVADGLAKGQTLLTLGTKQASGRFFSQRELPAGGSAVTAENWQGAMKFLRERFKTK